MNHGFTDYALNVSVSFDDLNHSKMSKLDYAHGDFIQTEDLVADEARHQKETIEADLAIQYMLHQIRKSIANHYHDHHRIDARSPPTQRSVLRLDDTDQNFESVSDSKMERRDGFPSEKILRAKKKMLEDERALKRRAQGQAYTECQFTTNAAETMHTSNILRQSQATALSRTYFREHLLVKALFDESCKKTEKRKFSSKEKRITDV